MPTPTATALDPSLKSDIAPALDSHGGAAGLVGAKLDGLEAALPSDPSGSNIEAQASRSMGVENALKAAGDFKDSHESNEPDDLQRRKAVRMAGAFDRMQPPQLPYSGMDTMYQSLKKMVDGIVDMLKKIFGKDTNREGEPTLGASGYGPEFDDIMKKMEKSMGQFEDRVKDAKREAEHSLDTEIGPAGPGVSAPGVKS